MAAEETVETPPLSEMKSVEEGVVEAERIGMGRRRGRKKARDGGRTSGEEVKNLERDLAGVEGARRWRD